ncbi:MAG TPA: biosynthetic peptidoglycan transglycosylase [Burkholderiaceae bacterium]|nr:biosynthetic peptidoglycan transglycosylase [Burkholderiaceae bacterium]
MNLKSRTLLRRALFGASVLAFAGIVFVATVLAIALHALKPAPDEWRTTVNLGPWSRELSMPGLIRWAAHPLAAPLLDGRVLHTRFGRWQLQRDGHDLGAVCAPCRVQLPALGAAPLQFARAHLRASHEGAGRFAGMLTLAENGHELVLDVRAQLDRRGADVKIAMASTPMATVVQVLGHDLPEAARVQVGGTLAFNASARWPEATWQAKPVLRDFTVAGLGTERLLDAQLPAACRTSAGDSAVLAGWLPRALIAAEDARFYEHPGYELDPMLAAWQHNQRDGAPLRGGSTLTQQLAKFTITGDDRSATRKLRELLYAVEMERTLGKARILQLYLALAPWGDGVCGAERAAQVYLGKSAAKLGPVSAAWLVSLLRNPDTQLQRATRAREIDRERIKQIVAGMRPMSPAQRTLATEQLGEWMPW